jgi:hypothetical protein
MNAFVDPRREGTKVAPEFNKWFNNQLGLHWKYAFGKGLLVIKLPMRLRIFA